MKKRIILLACTLTLTTTFYAQEEEHDSVHLLEQRTQALEKQINKLKQFKFSGYIQTQFQSGEEFSSLKVGSNNVNGENRFNRLGIRRGRFKMEYEKNIVTGVLQLDATEKGLGIKDIYIAIKDPWIGRNSFKAGVFNRPFGYEVSYSSSRRESPERATINTTLFPEERDLGVMLTLQASENSPLHFLKLETALIGGNGIKLDMDNRMDFIAHLSANKTFKETTKLSGGLSYYLGSTYQGSTSVFKIDGKQFIEDKDPSNLATFAKREYFGFDLQFETTTAWGKTKIFGEYLFGTQPGNDNNSKSPNYSTLPTEDTYIRNFNGYYITFVQDFGNSPLSIVAKYDVYDPNTKASKNEIGLNNTGKGDITYTSVGGGLLWRINNDLRLTAYFDWIENETSTNLNGFEKDITDDVFSLRLQYKF